MLLKEAVALAHQLGQSGKKCWLRKLQELFNAAGLPSAFSCTGCENSLRYLLMTRFRYETGIVSYPEPQVERAVLEIN